MIHRTTTLLVLLLLAAGAIQAQEGWLIPFAAAYQPDLVGFRSKFAEHDLPEPGVRQYGWGIELRSYTNGLLVGPLYFRTWDDVETEDFQLRTESSGIFGEVGFKLAPFSFLTIVPMVGVGGLTQTFNIRARSQDVNIDTLLIAPGQNASITSGMKLAGLAALELGITAATTSGSYGVALRAGYLYSPFDPDWHLSNGARVTGTPTTRLRGPFFSIGFLIVPAPDVSSSTF